MVGPANPYHIDIKLFTSRVHSEYKAKQFVSFFLLSCRSSPSFSVGPVHLRDQAIFAFYAGILLHKNCFYPILVSDRAFSILTGSEEGKVPRDMRLTTGLAALVVVVVTGTA
jgi:hypothetical protein